MSSVFLFLSQMFSVLNVFSLSNVFFLKCFLSRMTRHCGKVLLLLAAPAIVPASDRLRLSSLPWSPDHGRSSRRQSHDSGSSHSGPFRSCKASILKSFYFSPKLPPSHVFHAVKMEAAPKPEANAPFSGVSSPVDDLNDSFSTTSLVRADSRLRQPVAPCAAPHHASTGGRVSLNGGVAKIKKNGQPYKARLTGRKLCLWEKDDLEKAVIGLIIAANKVDAHLDHELAASYIGVTAPAFQPFRSCYGRLRTSRQLGEGS
ncbi:hypothetical protein B5807_01657 [Epicoccum nigrum]|uniref:Uncharacterized protein n=1 Tax=Epicoccum nigrum TaxID=105696 RepID=A0A1Y2MH85_EPING|nr:hypothetical protein B5807_01657 [Epicoccum nigrum]